MYFLSDSFKFSQSPVFLFWGSDNSPTQPLTYLHLLLLSILSIKTFGSNLNIIFFLFPTISFSLI